MFFGQFEVDRRDGKQYSDAKEHAIKNALMKRVEAAAHDKSPTTCSAFCQDVDEGLQKTHNLEQNIFI